jgi:hypothetical protein
MEESVDLLREDEAQDKQVQNRYAQIAYLHESITTNNF